MLGHSYDLSVKPLSEIEVPIARQMDRSRYSEAQEIGSSSFTYRKMINHAVQAKIARYGSDDLTPKEGYCRR